MKWYRIPGKLVSLTRREFRDLIRAQLAIVRAQITVWTRRRGTLLQMIDSAAVAECAGSEERAQELDVAVRRVARFGLLRPQCLVRAVALHQLLTRAGIRGSRVRIGVRLNEAEFSAHAWVVWGRRVFGDEDYHVRQFATISDGRTVS